MRKDTSLEIIYHNLALELSKEISYLESNNTLSIDSKEGIKRILEALIHLCNVRKEMINVYQAILAQSTKGEFDNILTELEQIEKTMFDLERDLCILGLGIKKEINVLLMLLKARTSITNYAFQDTCISPEVKPC
jgi:hypothetical protein